MADKSKIEWTEATWTPPIAELLEFCRIIEDKAKEPAP